MLKILQTNVSMPSYTRDILGFIQNALQGVYELDNLTVEEIRSELFVLSFLHPKYSKT